MSGHSFSSHGIAIHLFEIKKKKKKKSQNKACCLPIIFSLFSATPGTLEALEVVTCRWITGFSGSSSTDWD